MTEEHLSPDEVDALLDGVSVEDAEPVVSPVNGVRNHALGRTERAIRGRLPALDRINERLARALRAGLLDYTSRHALIEPAPVDVLTYDDFLSRLALPSAFNVLTVKPLRGSALLVCEPKLIFAIIDTLFGGTGRLPDGIEGRTFSATEQRIVRRIVDLVCQACQTAWAEVYPLEFEYQRSEAQLQFASVARPTDTVLVTSLAVEIGHGGGQVHLCMPYANVEPIRELLAVSAPGAAGDTRFIDQLTRGIQRAEVELVADLATAQATVADLLKLRVGDFIELDLNQTLTAHIDNMPVFTCRYGTSNDRYAVRIQEFLTTGEELGSGALNVNR